MSLFLKIKIFSALSLAIVSTIAAARESHEEFIEETVSSCFSRPLFEVKTGYFFFSRSKTREIYGQGGLDVQLSASYPLWNLTSKWTLNAYGAAEYFRRSGESIGGHQKTSVWTVPISVGLKPVYAIHANTRYYFAAGPRYLSLHQRNHSSYVYKNKSKSALGFFVNTGLNHTLRDRLIIDIFGEYSYAKARFHCGEPQVYTRNTQVGGFTFGGGLGYAF